MRLERSSCFSCGRAEEDGAHLFIKCKLVKKGWRALGLERERMQLESITGVDAMLDKLWELHERKRMLIIIFWWHWWNNRNKIREGELPIATFRDRKASKM